MKTILNEYKAIDFFKCLDEGDSKYLNVKNHLEVFKELYDAFFEQRNDPKSIAEVQGKIRIEGLKHKLAFLDFAYTLIDEVPLNREHVIQVENALEQAGLNIDLTIPEEALKKIKRQASTTQNLIKSLAVAKKDKEAVEFDFTSILISFENVMGFSIPEDVSVGKFIAYEKLMIEKSKKNNG